MQPCLFTKSVQRLFSLSRGGIRKEKKKEKRWFRCFQRQGPLSLQAYSKYSTTLKYTLQTFLKKTCFDFSQKHVGVFLALCYSYDFLKQMLGWVMSGSNVGSRGQSQAWSPLPCKTDSDVVPAGECEDTDLPKLGLLLKGRGMQWVGRSKHVSLEACKRLWTLPNAFCLQLSVVSCFQPAHCSNLSWIFP